MSVEKLQLQHEVQQFLYEEALLLDNKKFDDWLSLFSADATYWVPATPEQDDPLYSASIIYEDVPLLRMRITRMSHPHAYSLQPQTQTSHSVSNVIIQPADDNSLQVSTKLTLACQQAEKSTVYSAQCSYDLNVKDAGFEIAHKRIDLVGCDQIRDVISVLF